MGLGIHDKVGGYKIKKYIEDASVWNVKEGCIEGLRGIGIGIEDNEEGVRRAAKNTEHWRSGCSSVQMEQSENSDDYIPLLAIK